MIFSVSRLDPGCRARTGTLALLHGTVRTPCFMPVGTNATVKAIRNRELETIGVNLILGNTYHLYLRPGCQVIGEAGGLHSFMGWPHNILTDSGGYQVFSLASFRKVEDQGVFFRSHIDGSSHRLTPEDILDIQMILGSDVMMPLDECTRPGIPPGEAQEAVGRTSAWLLRTSRRWKERKGSKTGLLFGIMQGNFYKELRNRSAAEMMELDLPGYAIGGLSVGEEFPVFQDLLGHSASLLPHDKPRYLMGIGTPLYILEAVEAGTDLFDCVFPTRTARNAQVFSSEGPLALRNEKYRTDFRPIDETCECETCRNHTRAYLRHLFKAREIEAAVLATCHNLTWLHRFVQSIQEAITRGEFLRFKKDFLASQAQSREQLVERGQ